MVWILKMEHKLDIPASVEPAADQVDGWGDTLGFKATTVNDRRIASVPDDGTFGTKVATPSSDGYNAIVDILGNTKSDRSPDEVKMWQRYKLSKSFPKWSAALDYAFATVDGVAAKRFKEAVANKKTNWATMVAQLTLRITGDKIRGRGASAICAYSLVGLPGVMGMLRPADIWVAGTPYNIARTGERPALKAAVQGRLVQAGITIIISGFDAAIIAAQNGITATLLTGLADVTKADPFVAVPAPDVNFCSYVYDGGKLFLHTRVGLT